MTIVINLVVFVYMSMCVRVYSEGCKSLNIGVDTECVPTDCSQNGRFPGDSNFSCTIYRRQGWDKFNRADDKYSHVLAVGGAICINTTCKFTAYKVNISSSECDKQDSTINSNLTKDETKLNAVLIGILGDKSQKTCFGKLGTSTLRRQFKKDEPTPDSPKYERSFERFEPSDEITTPAT
ncbi:hypothetical protein KUTeg_021377, partial [Tegillarca granosa]